MSRIQSQLNISTLYQADQSLIVSSGLMWKFSNYFSNDMSLVSFQVNHHQSNVGTCRIVYNRQLPLSVSDKSLWKTSHTSTGTPNVRTDNVISLPVTHESGFLDSISFQNRLRLRSVFWLFLLLFSTAFSTCIVYLYFVSTTVKRVGQLRTSKDARVRYSSGHIKDLLMK